MGNGESVGVCPGVPGHWESFGKFDTWDEKTGPIKLQSRHSKFIRRKSGEDFFGRYGDVP